MNRTVNLDPEIEEIRKRKLEMIIKKMEYPKKPIEITDGTFDETLKKYPLLVVDCWAEWCGPCRMIAPTIEALAVDLSGKVVFGKLNVDNNMKTAQQFGIMSIPTILIFKNGELVDRVVGALPRNMIEAKLRPHMD